MKDYEVVLNYVKRATDALVAVVDELEEFGDKGEQRFADEALDLMKKVKRLYMRVCWHRRVQEFAAQGDALRNP